MSVSFPDEEFEELLDNYDFEDLAELRDTVRTRMKDAVLPSRGGAE